MYMNKPSEPSTRKPKKHAYGTYRYKNPRQHFRWVGCPEGCFVKAALGAYAEFRNPNLHMDGKFKECGLTPSLVFEWALYVMPWLPTWFEKKTGRTLTKGILFDRLHKQFYKNGVTKRSDEHYTLDPMLRDYISRAERTVLTNKKTAVCALGEI